MSKKERICWPLEDNTGKVPNIVVYAVYISKKVSTHYLANKIHIFQACDINRYQGCKYANKSHKVIISDAQFNRKKLSYE